MNAAAIADDRDDRKGPDDPHGRHDHESRDAATPDTIVVPATADCTLRGAAELRGRLLPLIAETRAVMIDPSAVSLVDFAGLQVLLAFVRTRRAAKLDVGWTARSAEIDLAARRLGIEQALELRDSDGGAAS